MGRHQINKLMRHINMDKAAHASYLDDPEGFVAEWEDLGATEGGVGVRDDPPAHPQGDRLTSAERDAFIGRDYRTLYELGAHPYLLWSFTEAVWTPEVSREELVEDFRSHAGDVGYPDITT